MENAASGSAHFAPRFPTTLWTVLLEARRLKSDKELEPLLTAYWRPVYSVLRLSWSQSHEDAKDLTQAFYLSLLESGFANTIDPAKGRLRDFLKAALKHFMLDYKKSGSRLKRGGHLKSCSIEEMKLDVPSPLPDSKTLFDTMWAQNLVARALESVDKNIEDSESSDHLRTLFNRKMGKPPPNDSTYRELASELSITEKQVKHGLEWIRLRLKSAVIDQIRSYASSEAEVREELDELFASL